MARRKASKPKRSKTALTSRQSPDQLSIPTGYVELLDEIKARIRSAQIKAALAVNSELIVLYWSIGRDIVQRQRREGWGAKVIDRLAADLRSEFPQMSGLSRTNVYRMRAFYLAYESECEIVPQPVGQLAETGKSTESQLAKQAAALIVPQPVGQLARGNRPSSSTAIPAETARELDGPIPPQPVAQIPWGHNVDLIEKLKDHDQRLWYAQQTTANGWFRTMLLQWIESDLFAKVKPSPTSTERFPPPNRTSLSNCSKIRTTLIS